MTAETKHTIALLDWTHLIEDYLDKLHISIETFATEMTGGWVFGYTEALRRAGVHTVFFCFSARIKATQYFTHGPTGATVCVLPAPRLYLRLRRFLLNPYATKIAEAVRHPRWWQRPFHWLALHLAGYTATPMRRLFAEMAKNNCELLLCQEYEHPRFDRCVLAGRRRGLPVFATFQGGNWQQSFFEKWVRPFTVKKAAGLIIASGEEKERVQKNYRLPSTFIRQIFNPIDLAAWTGEDRETLRTALNIPPAQRRAVWHGRVDFHRKGLDVLLQAWASLCRQHGAENHHLLLVGAGNDASVLQEAISATGLPNITWINKFTNDRRQLYRYLASANVYVFPSRNEGFAVAPLEAMASGLPLIAADAPGVPDILGGSEANGGVLIRREDSEALAAHLHRLFVNKEEAEGMGTRAALYARQHFSLEGVGAQLRSFLFSTPQHR